MRSSLGYTDELEYWCLRAIINIKEAAKKKMRLRVTGLSQAENWYAFSNKGYIMTYKDYNISKDD